METASGLRGMPVITREEGAQLGRVAGVYVSTETNTISAITIRPGARAGKGGYVPSAQIQLIGKDVVLVSSESALRASGDVPGRSLKDLQGSWVTTNGGKHVGTLIDLDFSPKSWEISELSLAEDRHLAVTAQEIKIGDEIIVPPEYVDRVEISEKTRTGILGRLMGEEMVEDVKNTVKRILRRSRSEEKRS